MPLGFVHGYNSVIQIFQVKRCEASISLAKPSPIAEEVLKLFEESEFDMPTPIQSIAWPILSQKRDLVGIASTGSGKTLAVRHVFDASVVVVILLRLVHSPSRLSRP